MESIDIVSLLIENYAGASALVAFVTLKGIASVIANNLHTEEWGKVGQVIDWLASNNKKGKLTGDPITDVAIARIVKESKPVKKITKFLNMFS